MRPSIEMGKIVHGAEGSQVHFTADATDPGNDDLTYVWDLGDGTIVTGNDFYHTYEDNGFYVVTLTVTDGDGGKTVKVMSAKIWNLAPSANAGQVKNVHPAQSVYFEGGISDAGASDSLSIVWNMGDGTIYRGVLRLNHVYEAVGVYTVVLIVTDDEGAQTLSKTWVYVTERL